MRTIFLLWQVSECLNSPQDLENYEFHDREVTIFRPRYDVSTCHFQGPYEPMGYIMFREDEGEHFLDFRYSKQNS